MKRGVWIKGVGLLVLVILVVGLGACSKSAEVRESPATTPAATAVSGGGTVQVATPAPGQTVVSAVSPVPQTPGTEAQATPGAGTAVVEPAEGATVQPTPPPTSAPASEAPQAGVVWHTVQRGETLSSLARRYDTTWQAIAQANGISNPSQIYAGQRLKIPTSGSSSGGSTSGGTTGCRYRHTVQRGEWVWQIARTYGVSPYAILSANGLTLPSASTIYAGMVLCIP